MLEKNRGQNENVLCQNTRVNSNLFIYECLLFCDSLFITTIANIFSKRIICNIHNLFCHFVKFDYEKQICQNDARLIFGVKNEKIKIASN